MADTKISELSSATTTNGTEVLPVVQTATTKKMAISVIKDYILGLLGSAATTSSTDYAPAAKGVTNGDSHDHSGGDGAQISYSTLSNLPTLGTAAATAAADYAPAAKGITNGDSHDHSGGDGAQVDHGGLAGLSDDDHSQYHNDSRGDARYLKQGKHTIWIPAAAMTARTTNGAAAGTAETSTNKVMLSSLDFDASTIEYAQFAIQMPESWDESTITAKFTWKHASTTTNFGVSWGIQGVALSDDDASDAAFGTTIYANDTGGTTGDIYRSPETSAVTIAGTPATGDYVVFQVLRKADDGTNDTLSIDAGLLGVSVFYTVAAGTD